MSDNPFEEFAVMLEGLVAELDSQMPDVISMAVMAELMAKHKDRIFMQGLDKDGKKIGEYDTDGSYFAKKAFVRVNSFKGQGVDKNGKLKKGNFKNGKERKSMYLPGGYSEFRDIQSRLTDFVNLKYTGSLERGINIVKLGTATLYGTIDLKESKKAEGLADKYSDFLSLSESEKEFIKTEIKDQVIIIAKKHGKSK